MHTLLLLSIAYTYIKDGFRKLTRHGNLGEVNIKH
jgi:hypothetical protein